MKAYPSSLLLSLFIKLSRGAKGQVKNSNRSSHSIGLFIGNSLNERNIGSRRRKDGLHLTYQV